jgi:hypothetical protein
VRKLYKLSLKRFLLNDFHIFETLFTTIFSTGGGFLSGKGGGVFLSENIY